MDAADAVELCARLRPHTTVPVHFEGWSHFEQGREHAERVFAGAPPDAAGGVVWAPLGAITA